MVGVGLTAREKNGAGLSQTEPLRSGTGQSLSQAERLDLLLSQGTFRPLHRAEPSPPLESRHAPCPVCGLPEACRPACGTRRTPRKPRKPQLLPSCPPLRAEEAVG
eukprot:gene23421-biopygen1256